MGGKQVNMGCAFSNFIKINRFIIYEMGQTMANISAMTLAIGTGCIIPEKWWKTIEVIEIQYKTVTIEQSIEEHYSIPAYTLSDEGLLSLYVNKGTFQVEYAIQEATQKERQRFGPFQRTIDVIQNEYNKEERTRTITDIVPATEIPVLITSTYFVNAETENEATATITKTNNKGYTELKLLPTDCNFVFSLDLELLADTEVAEEIRALGWSEHHFVENLRVFARPVTYSVTVETKAAEGINTKRDIPITGYTLSGITAEEILGY